VNERVTDDALAAVAERSVTVPGLVVDVTVTVALPDLE